MICSLRLNKVRAHRVLVVIRPAGDGLAAPLAGATQWSTGRRKEFVPRGMRAAQGKLFSPDGCSHEARGAAAPPPGFTTTQGRLGPNHPNPKGDIYGHPGIPARRFQRHAPDSARPFPTTGRNMPPPMRATMLAARRGAPSKAGRRIREPSFVTHRQRAVSVADGTHSHNLRQQAPAHPPSTAQRRGVDLGRFGAAGSAVSRGAKPRAAGMARRAFPWRQAQRAVPQARRQLDEESGVPPAYCNAAA